MIKYNYDNCPDSVYQFIKKLVGSDLAWDKIRSDEPTFVAEFQIDEYKHFVSVGIYHYNSSYSTRKEGFKVELSKYRDVLVNNANMIDHNDEDTLMIITVENDSKPTTIEEAVEDLYNTAWDSYEDSKISQAKREEEDLLELIGKL